MSLDNSTVVPFISSGGYTIDQSLRFNDDNTHYLSRTPSSAGNRKTWTWSGWVKRGNMPQESFFCAGASAGTNNNYLFIGWQSGDALTVTSYGSPENINVTTSALQRDVSAWYHIVVAFDTTQSTSSNRVKIYINGEQITSFSSTSYPTQNQEFYVNSTTEQQLGRSYESDYYFDGYLAEVNFIDGQALDSSYFGETDETYGHWKPIEYTGSYGTNGFYLDFDGTYQNDKSGNGNNFTATNLSTTVDVLLDSPTNNFCTMNPLDKASAISVQEGGLVLTANDNWRGIRSTFQIPLSGKWYWETVTDNIVYYMDCIAPSTAYISTNGYTNTGVFAVAQNDNFRYSNGNEGSQSSTTYGQRTVNTVVGWAVDSDTGVVKVYADGSLWHTFTGSLDASLGYSPAIWGGNSDKFRYNFGQNSSFAGQKTPQGNTDANGYGDFYYEPPSGYQALCTANLPTPAVIPSEHFNAVLYTGNASSQSIGTVGFQPGLSWQKSRSAAQNHRLIDEVRGSSQVLKPDATSSEVDGSVTFDADGFNFTANDGEDANDSGKTYVAWNWYGTASSGSSNTNGSITTTVSANQDAGFSIVSYTGGGSAGDTLGHGLSKAPEMMIWRTRDSVENWGVFNSYVQTLNTADRLYLNSTSAEVTSGDNRINALSSTTITLGSNNGEINSSSDNYIMYCFHSVEGFSKVGYYTGNNDANGPFGYTGFRPRWIMIKNVGGIGWWTIYDTARDPINDGSLSVLAAQNDQAEGTQLSSPFDILSNGFKVRSGAGSSDVNSSGVTYIYLAFAEYPFKYTNAR